MVSGVRPGHVKLKVLEARNFPFFVLSVLYLLPLVGEVFGGVKKTRRKSLHGGRVSST